MYKSHGKGNSMTQVPYALLPSAHIADSISVRDVDLPNNHTLVGATPADIHEL